MLKKEKRGLFTFLALFFMLYMFCFYAVQQGGTYAITPNTHNDRYFSMDDAYYVQNFYSVKWEDTGRVVKHPLFVAFAHYATVAERMILGEVSVELHYLFVVMGQVIAQTVSLFFLFKILYTHYSLNFWKSALLTGLYGISCSSLLFMLVAESYTYSGLVLILAWWCMLNKRPIGTVITGILAGGITITNFFIWALMALFYGLDFSLKGGQEAKRKLLNLFIKNSLRIGAAGVGLLGTIALLPLRQAFYGQLQVFKSSPANYRDAFPLFEAVKNVFYTLFGSPIQYIDTVNQTPFGAYLGTAVSFVPSAGLFQSAFIAAWIVLLAIGTYFGFKKGKLAWAPVAVLVFNLGLHGFIQYGLKEGFLYSLHHLFAQILLAALALQPENPRPVRYGTVIFTSAYFIFVTAINFVGLYGLFF